MALSQETLQPPTAQALGGHPPGDASGRRLWAGRPGISGGILPHWKLRQQVIDEKEEKQDHTLYHKYNV